MNILALDLSLTAPGVCYSDGSAETLKPGKLRGMQRLSWIRDEIACRLDLPGTSSMVDLVVLEGYSYASKGRSVIDIAELGGVVRLYLDEYGPPYVEIPPANLKRYATGRGNASKDDVLQAGVMRSGHTFADNNACDAWFLWCMAMEHYCPGDPRVPRMPVGNLEGLRKIEWPGRREA